MTTPAPDAKEPRRLLLTVRPHRIAILAFIAAAVVVTAMAVVGILLRQSAAGVNFHGSDQIALIGLGLLVGIAIAMMARPRLKIYDTGIRVRNILGDNFYEWPLVYRVAFPGGSQWAQLILPDDETHPVMAIQAMDRGRAVESLRQVRALHAQYAPQMPKAPEVGREAWRALQERQDARPLGRLEIIDRQRAPKEPRTR